MHVIDIDSFEGIARFFNKYMRRERKRERERVVR